jgi:Signal transduction histidine kinase
MINRLRYKFILINMILITIVLVITFIAVYASTQQRLVRDSMSILQRTATDTDHKEPLTPDGGHDKTPGLMQIATFTVTLDADNNIIEARGPLYDLTDQTVLRQIVDTCLANQNNTGIIPDTNLRYLKLSNDSGTKIAFVDRQMETNTLSALIKTSLLVGLGSLLAFFFISLYLAKWALRPVAKTWEQQKQFVADASHELKTPLAVILANTGIVLSHPEQTVRNQAKWLEYIQIEAKRMNTLVENLLFLAKTDDSKPKMVMSRVNLSDIVTGAVLPFESVIFEQNKNLVSNIDSEIYVGGDENRLKELVNILLDNACKYADEKGTITVLLAEKADHQVKLAISNTGTYIPRDQIDQIFERFFRVDKSRVREQGGYGLGLSIAESIVRMHNAKISVQSTPATGTTFNVIFHSQSIDSNAGGRVKGNAG